MMGWGPEGERRADFRIPLECPVVLMHEGAEAAREGVLENLSRCGAQVVVRHEDVLEAGAAVHVDFGVHGTRHGAKGTVRWCRAEKDASRMGLRLDAPLSLSFPLEDVASICARLSQDMAFSQAASQDTTAMLARTFAEQHVQTYWGSLFWVLSDAAHGAYAYAAGHLNLSVFRLERFLAALSAHRVDEAAWVGVRSALKELEGPEHKLKQTAHLFRLIKDKSIVSAEPHRDMVNLDLVLSASIHEFQHAAHILANNGLLPIRFERNKVRPVAGRGLDFTRCFETLLLFTYQSALFGKARAIAAEIQEDTGGIQIVLRHDGMQILDKPRAEIHPMDANFLQELVPRDLRNGLWLHGSLLPVRDHSPRLVVHSEAGKNRIELKFPWPDEEKASSSAAMT